jgi:tRNA pseudouridine55 synthase
MDAFSGIVLLDKPAGITSFQALFPLKKVFRTKRVGHAGSLDMRASGLIVAAVGRATRLLPYIEAAHKSYSFRLHLGYETDTLEWDGEVTKQDECAEPFSVADVESVLSSFRGSIRQVPPNYSAIKIQGKRASDLMLRGREVNIPSRPLEIHRLEMKGMAATPTSGCSGRIRASFDMECDCSKGTYIRSLCRDMGLALGSFGCVSHIHRVRIGSLRVSDAVTPGELTTASLQMPQSVLPFPVVSLNLDALTVLRHGNWIPWKTVIPISEGMEPLVLVEDATGAIQFVCTYEPGRLMPKFFVGVGE